MGIATQGLTRKSPSEMQRILNLPTRKAPKAPKDCTRKYSKKGATMSLKPVQSWALSEIGEVGGGFLSVGVGHGKTLIGYLTPKALGVDPEDALVLLPANLRSTFKKEGKLYAKHFNVSQKMQCLSYAMLSRPTSATYLKEKAPKVIICDEAHYLANQKSTRTKRFMRYLKANPETKVVVMSGTLINKSIMDCAHLARISLKDNSPFPEKYMTLKRWAACIDGDDWNRPDRFDRKAFKPLLDSFGTLKKGSLTEKSREAFHNRLVQTKGVIHTATSSCEASILLTRFKPKHTEKMSLWLDLLENKWELPNGDWLTTSLEMNLSRRTLNLGYYHTWEWNGDKRNDADREWNYARLEYQKQLRRFFKKGLECFDSHYLIEEGIKNGEITDTELVASYNLWQGILDRSFYNLKYEVLCGDILLSVVDYAKTKSKKGRGIVWYEGPAQAAILAQSGIKVFLAGQDCESYQPKLGEVVAMSVKSHGTGKNLQAYDRMFVVDPSSNGRLWEQLIGRLHRQGQTKDEIHLHVYDPYDNLKRAKEDAKRAYSTTKQPQKLLLATETK